MTDVETLLQMRIADLEARLEESEETLDAIRRGDVDAVVVSDSRAVNGIYTLENPDRPYQVLIEQMQEGAVTLGDDGVMLYGNRRLAEILGVPQERVIGRSLVSFLRIEDGPTLARLLITSGSLGGRDELTVVKADGSQTPVSLSLSQLQRGLEHPLLCGVLTDLTLQHQHMKELSEVNDRLVAESAQREVVEAALRQSQKMEAVGQLTGGLAHDFNNLLTGITGSLELLQTRIAQGRLSEVDRYVTAAQGAARRAAALTHRLLAFSRRQTLEPKPTDVKRLVTGMQELIDRTVGPEIAVETVMAGDLWPTLIDSSQLENALLNLCINARDAMPDGGKLTIETANQWLDERVAHENEVPAGQYVSLCVSDNGTGMTPEVIARAFDPFFTTKPIGTGTGLGLSMIYGFARQSGGHAQIRSEMGMGTTVCLYLPRLASETETIEPASALLQAPRDGRGETVLVVDDEPTIRMLVAEVLEDIGYTAIEAADGAAGLKVLQSDCRIDLLVTDVGLPGGLNGRQVADAARLARPDLKVLFITGYAENAILSNGHLDPGMHVLTKPFSLEVLASRIRDLIKA